MSEGLEAGAAAPEFDLPVDGGGRASLSGLKGKKVVLYFYPKDDTSGCTAEAIAFNGLRDKFEAAGAFLLYLALSILFFSGPELMPILGGI